jgi:hypothetical protein
MRCVQVMEFPVVMLVRFWANHHLLDLLQRPLWRVVKDRSRSYVDKIIAGAPLSLSQAAASQVSACAELWRNRLHLPFGRDLQAHASQTKAALNHSSRELDCRGRDGQYHAKPHVLALR